MAVRAGTADPTIDDCETLMEDQMSRQLFDVVEVDIPCPNCGHEAKHSVGWLRIHKRVHCARCGRRSDIEMEEVNQALEALDRAWDNLLDRLQQRQ